MILNKPAPWPFIVLLIIEFSIQTVSAQFLINKEMPCPYGNKVELDTVFYTPDNAMPFDRCFYFKLTKSGKIDASHFRVFPIDKNGRPTATRRDYHLYLRAFYPDHYPLLKDGFSDFAEMLFTRKKWKRRENISYSKFKKSLYFSSNNAVASFQNKGNTEIVLRMPPLEPNRDYRIEILGISGTAANDLMEVGDLIMQSKVSKEDHTKFEEAINKHKLSVKNRSKGETYYVPETFEDYLAHLTSFQISIPKSKLENYVDPTLYFSKESSNTPTDAQIKSTKGIKVLYEVSLDRIVKFDVKLPITDTDGDSIRPFQNGSYKLWLFTTGKGSRSNKTLIPIGRMIFKDSNQPYEYLSIQTDKSAIISNFEAENIIKINSLIKLKSNSKINLADNIAVWINKY